MNYKKIFAVIVLTGAALSIGCSSIKYNKDYAGDRFPREFDTAFIGVNLDLVDGGSSEPITKEEETAVRDMILKKLTENKYGFNAAVSTNGIFKDTVNEDNQKAVISLIYDCNLEKSCTPGKGIIESPAIQKAIKQNKRYNLFINYSGSSQSARNKTGKIALFLFTPVAADYNDHSFLSAVIYDKVANKYVFNSTSSIFGLTDDPRKESVIESHVKDLFDEMKTAKEAKEEKK
ncbi:MAG: hypothetical protein V1874_12535 [Spirochaetota bacterium]